MSYFVLSSLFQKSLYSRLTRSMQLNELLDKIISREVYEEVKVEREIQLYLSELPKDIINKIKKEKDLENCKEKLNKLFQNRGYENFEVLDIDPSSNTLRFKYTAYYTGSKHFPEIHLKTLLIVYDGMGRDLRDPDVFDEIVEKARCHLGKKNRKEKEERLYHFASLFKQALSE